VLIISEGVTSDIRQGTDISILVTGFKNPISTDEVSGFTVTSMVVDDYDDKLFYPIDSGFGTLQVTDYALIQQGRFEVKDQDDPISGMIQQADQMKLTFYLPVPLDAGCVVTVSLPGQYDTSLITSVNSQKLFGSYELFSAGSSLQISEEDNSFTFNPCAEHRENDDAGVLEINELL
jgi:hypothetical protein